jgi:hypothetical protein
MKHPDFIPRLIPFVRLAQVETQLHFTQDFNKKNLSCTGSQMKPLSSLSQRSNKTQKCREGLLRSRAIDESGES